MKKVCILLLIFIIAFQMCACAFPGTADQALPAETGQVSVHPSVMDLGRGKLKSIPAYDPGIVTPMQVDLRSYDLSPLNLKKKGNELAHADFDTNTIWPDRLPADFNPKKRISLGKNPGLNLSKLHEKGVTGKGVGIAIIDGALLVEHKEYGKQLKLYEQNHCQDKTATVSGCMAASSAAGKSTGVAPEASLYYIAETNGTVSDNIAVKDLTWLTQSLHRIMDLNATLPKEEKIRVVSISTPWSSKDEGYPELMKEVEKAKSQGLFVVSPSIYETYDRKFYFNGLNRSPIKDPDVAASYEPGTEWGNDFYLYRSEIPPIEGLFVPMDARCFAAPTGKEDYAFYSVGSWSGCSAYIAGLYALCCQVKPDITPELFWKKALETSDTIEMQKSYFKRKLRGIPNPERLIENLK